ncbi:G-protein coupled receptor dmsr-1 [Halyomorpha halys]|uniref:G-protein coupled receptor dmsr-1 n=1 Tax=Halyomorpha halys TaxID=286706 RepID=UPI0006D5219B|nr:sex peptide receptor [Halyomorpha halys]
MNGTAVRERWCGEAFDSLHDAYKEAHGYSSLVVCLFGSVANVLNIVVLTRREMSSPTNAILTGLAVADLLVMLEYIPYCWREVLAVRPKRDKFSYGHALLVLLHAHFSQVFHTISIWLTITLAVWRYIAVVYPQRNREWCGMQQTIIAITSGYLICPILCIPLYLAFDIQPKRTILDEFGNKPTANTTKFTNTTLYYVDLSELGRANDNLLATINFWVYSIVIKIIPCIALTILSLRLISALIDTKRRREALTSGSRKTPRIAEKERQTDRTTRMLLAVLLLFLITEFPQGVLVLLSIYRGQDFFTDCYQKLGEIMDILALINSAINFMIYCAMSRQFRTTFSLLFRPRWLPVPQVENAQNNHTTTMVTQV